MFQIKFAKTCSENIIQIHVTHFRVFKLDRHIIMNMNRLSSEPCGLINK